MRSNVVKREGKGDKGFREYNSCLVRPVGFWQGGLYTFGSEQALIERKNVSMLLDRRVRAQNGE